MRNPLFEIEPSSDDTLASLEQRLPRSADDPRVRVDAEGKIKKLRTWMEEQQLDAVLISRRDNFACLTVSGDNHVLKNTEVGAGHLLVTADHQFLLAYTMDGERILGEQIPGQGYELVAQRWYEGDPRRIAFSLAGGRIAADTTLPEVPDRSLEIQRLHDPLTGLEIDRCRWLGRQTALLLEAVAKWVQPGRTEEDVARQLHAAFALNGIELDVLLVGSDERVERLRHSLPTQRAVSRICGSPRTRPMIGSSLCQG